MMFARLILAHLVGDFVLQNRWLVVRKRTPGGLSIHLGLLGLAMLPLIWDRFELWWPWMLAILAVHGALDWAKIRLEESRWLPPIVLFLADQAAHVLTIAAVVALVEPGGLGLTRGEGQAIWWIASAYLIATFALSIALPLWLDPPSLMQRSSTSRMTLIVASALALTLAWRGWLILVPVVALILHQVVAGRLARAPVTKTFAVEFWSAIAVGTSLGWVLA